MLPGRVILFEMFFFQLAGYRQTEYWFRAIDAVATRQGYARLEAYTAAALEHTLRYFGRDLIDGPAQDGNGHERLTTHGIDVADGVNRSNGTERKGVVYDGHKKIGGAYNTGTIAEVINGG